VITGLASTGLVRRFPDAAPHVHVKDYTQTRFATRTSSAVPHPGEGAIDFDRVFDTLRGRGYQGALTPEV
jgi:sugar phosphate isomerase/epimerase